MKKIVIGFAVALAIPVVIIIGLMISLYMERSEESKVVDDKATGYIGEKYGMEAVIVSKKEPDFVEGLSYQMAFKEQEDVVFTVTVETENYATIYRDNYKPMFAAHEAQQQVEKLLPQIETLGFEKPLDGEIIQQELKEVRDVETGETFRELVLENETSYKTVDASEIQAIVKLLELVRDNNVDIHSIDLANRQEDYGVSLDLSKMGDIQTPEEVEAYIVRRNLNDPYRAGEAMQAKWQEAATQAETERFRFHNEENEQWIECFQTSEEGGCTILWANITFESGQLSSRNPHLAEDFDAIFAFFDSIQPQPTTVELQIVDQGKPGYQINLLLDERENYSSTEELIEDRMADYEDE
ncbi:hypothetical protein [Planococcus soli]|uniref:hypothetical protein n=1 Tax=Planococcus soli TaxID=2666072 RepID=UPI00115CB1A7|nr:hypothetical protein [Planococcus soli]